MKWTPSLFFHYITLTLIAVCYFKSKHIDTNSMLSTVHGQRLPACLYCKAIKKTDTSVQMKCLWCVLPSTATQGPINVGYSKIVRMVRLIPKFSCSFHRFRNRYSFSNTRTATSRFRVPNRKDQSVSAIKTGIVRIWPNVFRSIKSLVRLSRFVFIGVPFVPPNGHISLVMNLLSKFLR